MTATFNSTNLYVARYAPDGAPLSSFQHGGPPEDHPLDAAVTPDGGVLVAGFFGGRDTNLGGAELAAGGGSDGFVASYDAAGGHRWSHGLATPGDESAMGVAATPDGGAVVVGGFDDALPLGEGLLSGGEQDGFVVRYDAAGAVLWARSLSGPGMDALRGVAVADDGSVYVGGTFSDSASLAGRSIVSAGGGDIVVARFTADGELAGILTAGGPGADSANTLSVGPSGELYVTGSFEGEAALPGGTLSAAGSTDAFLARLDPADLD
jgi:DNA-binding beta-propeller fold protein YncE